MPRPTVFAFQSSTVAPQTSWTSSISGEEVTIRELAEAVKAATGSTAKIEWDATKPDGTPRKLCDTALIRSLGWKPEIDLKQGLEMTVASYRAEVAAGTVRLGGR